MKIRILTTAGAAVMGLSALAGPHEINVDFSKKGHEIAPSMYGLFFEEINHAGDGGLYAELIQNRGFEEHTIPGGMTYRDGEIHAPEAPSYFALDTLRWHAPWNIEKLKMRGWEVTGPDGTFSYKVDKAPVALHPATPNAMAIEIRQSSKQRPVSLENTGYWGIAVTKGEKYDLRFYLNSGDYKGEVVAQIFEPGSGEVIASKSFKVKADGKWNEYKGVLTASATTGSARFRLQFNAKGKILTDYVSLFPQNTFKGRKNGMRADIAEKLANLHPAFLRWPGGCIVEGINLGNRVRWEETIGDPMTRPGEFSLWGYRSTYGFGYHEFLQFCEDMGMDAMFVANAGLSCSIRNGDYISGEEKLQPFLRSIENAIEYAMGDVSTEYGAMRAANGHPEPFRLKYMEIGNENSTERYTDNFNFLYSHLKKKYPDITFINTLAWWNKEIDKVPALDMIDPHWYEDPMYFYNSSDLFNKVPRGKYDVYVGEYACNNGVGSGNLEAALSEAAFMMGMERNSDVVKMASYAPLLTNVNAPNWMCNLIWFDNNRTSGRASYYVQKMFSENRPDYNVGISPDRGELNYLDIDKGSFGFGTWDTQVEYKDIVISTSKGDRTVNAGDFIPVAGDWTSDGGELSQTSAVSPSLAWLKGFDDSNYTLRFKVRKTGGKEGFVVYFGLSDPSLKGFAFNIGGWGNTGTCVQSVVDGRLAGILTDTVPTTMLSDKWYDVRIAVTPKSAELWLDDEMLTKWNGMSYPLQFFNAGYDMAKGEAVIKAVNASDMPYKADFSLAGLSSVSARGEVVTLKSESLQDENSLDNPEKIVPVSENFDGFSKNFGYELPPYSLTIFRIKAKL